jgi:hypothetical protein
MSESLRSIIYYIETTKNLKSITLTLGFRKGPGIITDKRASFKTFNFAKVKEGENFNRRRHEVSALVNIWNISRIKI